MAKQTSVYAAWCEKPWAMRFWRGCLGRLLGIPSPLLSGVWLPRFDANGDVYMLLKQESPTPPKESE